VGRELPLEHRPALRDPFERGGRELDRLASARHTHHILDRQPSVVADPDHRRPPSQPIPLP
jgi:hypothetical protein